MNYTNADWKVIKTPDTQIVRTGNAHKAIGIWDKPKCLMIAYLHHNNKDHAVLIAAAPDMLVALENLYNDESYTNLYAGTRQMIEDALKKAGSHCLAQL